MTARTLRRLGVFAPGQMILLTLLILLTTPFSAISAQEYGRAPAAKAAASETPRLLDQVGFDQKLGEQVPFDLPFVDETGRDVTLGELADGKPMILVPAYYDCPMLCSLVISGVTATMRTLAFDAGDQFEMVVFSIDPDETPAQAAEAKANYTHRYNRPEAEGGMHFLTSGQDTIDATTAAIGFRYVYDDERDEWAHAGGIVVLTPEGLVSRTFYGIDYAPKDVRLGLIEAADGTIGNLVDEVLLYCFRYNPSTGKYSAVVLNILRLAGVATLVLIGLYFLVSYLRNRRTTVQGAMKHV